MSQTKRRYTYREGRVHTITSRGARARKGETIELSDEQVIDLTQRGILLDPVDGRHKLPDTTDEVADDPPADDSGDNEGST